MGEDEGAGAAAGIRNIPSPTAIVGGPWLVEEGGRAMRAYGRAASEGA
ncbi:hypothetical protein [Streptomyces sp. 4F14]